MKEKTISTPDVSLTSPEHIAARDRGTDHFRLWERNVSDRFKSMTDEEIKKVLRETANPFAVCFENWIGDFNISTGIRNANAFNAQEVFYLGSKRWDRRGAVGVHNYTEVQFLSTLDDFLKLKERYVIVGVDNVPGSVSISGFDWYANTGKNVLMVFGEEGVGLTPTIQSHCEAIVEIEMFGSVRSLNCGTASGIVMHDFVTKRRVHNKIMKALQNEDD